MSWFNTRGASAERILYSKVRYVRNVSKLPFGSAPDKGKLSAIYAKIEKLLSNGGFRIERLPAGAPASVLSLAEKHFIDADLVFSDGARTVYFNEPCNLTVSVGGGDLISIQSILPGRAIIEAKNAAAAHEEVLDSEICFAYSSSIGYLSSRAELCGSGLELSAGLYLPSLRLLGSREILHARLFSRGVMLSPMHAIGDNAGDLYTISYTPEHFASEAGAVEFFDALLCELDSLERNQERMLFPETDSYIDDAAYRAQGTLSCARKLSEGEMLSLLSSIRLALSVKSTAPEGLMKIEDVNFLYTEGLNGSLCASGDQKCASSDELDALRAAFFRKYISAKVTV